MRKQQHYTIMSPMLIYLKLISGILGLFFIGYLPAYFLLPGRGNPTAKNNSISEKLYIFFISFYIGALITSLFFIIMSLAKIEYDIWPILSLTLACFAFFIYRYFSSRFKGREKKETEETPAGLPASSSGNRVMTNVIFTLFILLITASILSALFFALLFPIRFWDAISCWSLKGRAFYIDSSISTFYRQHLYDFSHLSYPVYLPLMQTWLYFWMGEANENLVKVIFPMFYGSSCFFLYYYFRFRLKKLPAIIFVFIFSVLPIIVDHGYIEYTNLLFSTVLAVSVFNFYLSRVETHGQKKYLLLSAVFFSILAMIRSEGMIYIFLFLVLNLVFFLMDLKRKKRFTGNLLNLIFPVVAVIVISLPWLLLKARFGLPLLSTEWLDLLNSGLGLLGTADLKGPFYAIGAQILYSYYDSVRAFLGSLYGPVWVILFIFFLIKIKVHFKHYGWIFFVFILSGFVSVFLSLAAVEDFISSTERYMLHLFTLLYLWVVSNSIGGYSTLKSGRNMVSS